MNKKPSTHNLNTTALPFDEKNAEDFSAYTSRIQRALKRIEQSQQEAVTKANLARLSGVHRNTLRHRALMSCPAEHHAKANAADYGWPYSALLEISRARKQRKTKTVQVTPEQKREDEVGRLEKQLAKSRYQVAGWFNRTLELKQERDEARRSVNLLMEERKRLTAENERLRRQHVANIKSVK